MVDLRELNPISCEYGERVGAGVTVAERRNLDLDIPPRCVAVSEAGDWRFWMLLRRSGGKGVVP